jgi:imidazolonepropionase-like amidohydrolase
VRALSHTGGHGDVSLPDGTDLSGGMTEIADTVDEVRLAVRRVLRSGADLIKVCATGGMGSPYDDPDDEGLTVEEMKAVVDEVGRHGGKAVAAHAQGRAGILNAIRAGVTSIEHGYGLDDEACDLAGEHGIHVVPTLSTVYAGIDKDRMPDYHYQKKVRWSGVTKENISRAIERGGRIALGTDARPEPDGAHLSGRSRHGSDGGHRRRHAHRSRTARTGGSARHARTREARRPRRLRRRPAA